MQGYRVHFWCSARTEADAVYRCRARSLPALRASLPALLARHTEATAHRCHLDGWSIITVTAPTNLYKIVMAGGIHSGRITDTLPNAYRLADPALPGRRARP